MSGIDVHGATGQPGDTPGGTASVNIPNISLGEKTTLSGSAGGGLDIDNGYIDPKVIGSIKIMSQISNIDVGVLAKGSMTWNTATHQVEGEGFVGIEISSHTSPPASETSIALSSSSYDHHIGQPFLDQASPLQTPSISWSPENDGHNSTVIDTHMANLQQGHSSVDNPHDTFWNPDQGEHNSALPHINMMDLWSHTTHINDYDSNQHEYHLDTH